MNLLGKNIIITGAAHGLGRELAARLIPLSRKAILVDIDLSGLKDIARRYSTVLPIKCDLSSPSELQKLLANLTRGSLHYDLLINCAGIGNHQKITDLTPSEISRLISVNCLAPLTLTSVLISSGHLTPRALVVNIGSISGELGLPGLSLYSSSKSLLHSFTLSAQAENPRQVNFLLVILGSLSDTNFGQHLHSSHPPRFSFYSRFRTSSSSAAAAIIDSISKDRSALIYPGYLNPILSLHRHFPILSSFLKSRIYRRLF